MSPVIEVVVAAYNAQAYISETLSSILAQGPDVLVRVVDDGSTDSTGQIVRGFDPDRVRYLYQPHRGAAGAPRNAALRSVKAPYVAFFDADDIMTSGHLKLAVELLEAHPSWVAAAFDFVNFDHQGNYPTTQFADCRLLQSVFSSHGLDALSDKSLHEVPSDIAHRILSQESFFITGSVVYRTPMARAIGGFDETLLASEDFDFFWRIAAEGPIGVSGTCAFRRRLHDHNMSLNSQKILRYKALSRQKQLTDSMPAELRGALRDTIARALSDLAAEQMASSRAQAILTLLESLRFGLPVGQLPVHGFKALIKDCIRNIWSTKAYPVRVAGRRSL